MSTFLKLLPLELEGVDKSQYIDPGSEVEKTDNIVGTAPDNLKKLYTLWKLKDKAAAELALKATYSRSKEEVIEHLSKASEYHYKAEALKQLFWVAIHDEFSLWDKEVAGIRTGWQVIWHDDDNPSPDLRDYLQRLFG